MPMLRPLAVLLAATATAACAAGGHRVPDEDDRIDVAHRDSLVAGAAIPATMPFEGSVYPVPPSHRAPAAAGQRPHQAAGPAGAPAHHDAAPAGAEHAADEAQGAADPEPRPQPAQAPEPTVPDPAAPALPAADDTAHDADEHAGHTP